MTDNPQWQPGQAPPPPPNNPAHQPEQMAAGDERTWMILAHVSAPIAMIVSAGWLSFVGPLLVWLVKKDQSAAVRQAASGAFNFNLAAWLMAIIGWICFFTIILIPVAIIIWIIVFIVSVYAHVRGALTASKGQVYSYPFQIRVLS